ncbi:MAG: hypothetical protein QXT06_03505 [Candidatus Bathyarchaeia archaeon]
MPTHKVEVTINIPKILFIVNVIFIAVYILNSVGIEIPLLRQTTGLFYALLIPGTLLMLTLKIEETDVTNFILYSIGLSLASLLTLGLILNFGGQFIGISRPI